MNIESLTVKEHLNDYLCFGWEHTEDVRRRHGPHHYTEHVLVRNKDMLHYQEIKQLEEKYFQCKRNIGIYFGWDPMIALLLFILFVFPLIIYAIYKNNEKKEIEENNNRMNEQMKDILKEVKPLVEDAKHNPNCISN